MEVLMKNILLGMTGFITVLFTVSTLRITPDQAERLVK